MTTEVKAAVEKIAPVQGYTPGIPWEMHLRAYDAYCAKWSPQPALIDLAGRNCRGGFSVGELDMFIPGWRDELSERTRLLKEIVDLKERATKAEAEKDEAKRLAAKWANDGEHAVLANDFNLGRQEALRECSAELAAILSRSAQGGEHE